jgi:hypothetical protein
MDEAIFYIIIHHLPPPPPPPFPMPVHEKILSFYLSTNTIIVIPKINARNNMAGNPQLD